MDSPTDNSAATDPESADTTDLAPTADASAAPGLLARGGMGLIRFYQRAISPLTPPSCRFQPTCSQYTLIAIKRHGFVRGCWLGLRRLLRCHPFHPGGHDPVP